MLTLYQSRKSEDSDGSDERIIPPGRPYLTKVNGRLVMARDKKPTTTDIAIDLLGEVFGSRTTIVRKRSKSLEQPQAVPVLATGAPSCTPQLPSLPYTAPILQQPFAQSFIQDQQSQPPFLPFLPYQSLQPHQFNSPNAVPILQYPQPEPQRYTVPPAKPTEKDFEVLKLIDAHYNEISSKKTKRLSAGPATEADTSVHEEVTRTTITITKHVCANCGRLRSRKYHAQNPIIDGDTPTPTFCRKCQRDSSSTSGSDGGKKKQETFRSPKQKAQPESTPLEKEYIFVEEVSRDRPRSLTRYERVATQPYHPRQQERKGRRLSRFEEDMYESQERLRQYSLDSVSSQRSGVSKRRHRVERANPEAVPAAPWNTSHILRPRTGDETIVVTERFVYRPKKPMEEQRRQQEYIEKQAFQNHSAQLEEEASRYYHDDWSREEPVYTREERPRRDLVPGRYRRDSIHDSELADSESTDYYRAHDAVFHDLPLRAPSPLFPAPASPIAEAWAEIPPYLLSSDEETAHRVKAGRKGKSLSRERGSTSTSGSNYRAPLVREASEGGTESFNDDYDDLGERERVYCHEKALVRSPKHRQRASSYDGNDGSDMTEREQFVEREAKRVTFRSPTPNSPSAYSERSDRTDSFLRRKTSWDESGVASKW